MERGGDETVVGKLAERHGLSEDGVRTVLRALRSGGGTMAQFSHADFGGMSQWSPGMAMVGDMFNATLRSKLQALASDLSDYLRDAPPESRPADPPGPTTKADRQTVSGRSSGWWPGGLGEPSSVGSQNDMRYAAFPTSRRLVVEESGRATVYDTGDHVISGVSQSQSSVRTLAFTSQHGEVRLSDLPKVDPEP